MLPWKRIALAAAGLFAAAVVAITAFELLVGESVSSITGGSHGDGPTIGRIVGNTNDPVGPREDVPASDQPSPSPSGDPSTPPSEHGDTVSHAERRGDPVPLAGRGPDPRADHPGGRADHDAVVGPGAGAAARQRPGRVQRSPSRVSLSAPRAARRR